MIEINLHPAGRKASRRRGAFRLPSLRGGMSGAGRRDPWTAAAFGVPLLVVLIVAALWVTQRAEARGLAQQVVEAVADSSRLSDLRALSDSLSRRERDIQERVSLVATLDGNRFVWAHVLDEIGRALPDFTWLTSIRTDNPLPDLRFRVNGMAANPVTITTFVRSLGQSPYMGDVMLSGSQQVVLDKFVVQSFSLTVDYQAPPDSLVETVPVVEH